MINLEEIVYTLSVISSIDGSETEFVVYQGKENLTQMLKQISRDDTVTLKANHPSIKKTAGLQYTGFEVESLEKAISSIKSLFSNEKIPC